MEMIKIDTMGKDCPLPLIELKEVVAKSGSGQVIEVKFTCPEAVQNLPNYAEENGHEVLGLEKIGNEGWKITIKTK